MRGARGNCVFVGMSEQCGVDKMNARGPGLDRMLARLSAQRPDRALQGLEPLVWQRIAARSARSSPVLVPWRAAAAGLALSLGAAFGGVAAASAEQGQEMAVFSTRASLAPSTILEGQP